MSELALLEPSVSAEPAPANADSRAKRLIEQTRNLPLAAHVRLQTGLETMQDDDRKRAAAANLTLLALNWYFFKKNGMGGPIDHIQQK